MLLTQLHLFGDIVEVEIFSLNLWRSRLVGLELQVQETQSVDYASMSGDSGQSVDGIWVSPPTSEVLAMSVVETPQSVVG